MSVLVYISCMSFPIKYTQKWKGWVTVADSDQLSPKMLEQVCTLTNSK